MSFQLRRLGKPATIIGVKDILRLNKDVTRFGRHSQNDYFLDSAEYMCLISRWHAEIHRIIQDGVHNFFLRDNGLNGTYVNHVRVEGNVMLKKGDMVTFGHPNGKHIKPGETAVQEVSEFKFEFEEVDGLVTPSSISKTPSRISRTVNDTVRTLGSPIIPFIRTHQVTRPSPSSLRQETPSASVRNVNSNVSRKLIPDNDSNSTLVLKDISNTGNKSPGLVHLDQLFATHNSASPSRSLANQRSDPVQQSGTQSAPIPVESSDDDVYRTAINAAEQFNDDSGSDEDIFVDVEKQDFLQTQPATNPAGAAPISSTISQLQMHLQMPIPTPVPSYPSLSSIFEKSSQLTTNTANTSSGISLLNKLESPFESTFGTNSGGKGLGIKGKGQGLKRVNSVLSEQNPALRRQSTGSAKKRKRKPANKNQSRKRKSYNSLSNEGEDEEDSESELHTWHYDGDPCDSFDCCLPVADKVSWVQCDDCDKWYHTICAGTSYDIVKLSNAEFHCGCN